jgi:hypothetical protein
MKAGDMKRRYKLKLQKNTTKQAILVAKPRMAQDMQNYNEAWIILEKENYLPVAVKLFDPTGNIETVYSFKDVKINPGKSLRDRLWAKEDPYNPDFKKMNYKKVLPQINEAVERDMRQARPAGEQSAPRTGVNPPRNTTVK